ncbi:uncharacterized protein LOC141686354 [Apium graveolens]|uniref:uncharacterized protein LOC141686354 n=1 Tax=Apium graveolens TaxID=4045 RepID=UPI003D79718D
MNELEQLDDFCLKLNVQVVKIRALGESIREEYVVKKILRAVPTKYRQIASALEQFRNDVCRGEFRKPKDKVHRGEVNLAQTIDDEPALLMVMSNETTDGVILLSEGLKSNRKRVVDNIWYLNSEASNYMTRCREKFESLDRTIQGQIKFSDGSLVQIEGNDTINMVCKNGENRTLDGVYYILTLCSNIISLGQLSEEGNQVVLNGESMFDVTTVNDGAVAVDMYKAGERHFDLIITDLEMPLMTGIEATKELLNNGSLTKALDITKLQSSLKKD